MRSRMEFGKVLCRPTENASSVPRSDASAMKVPKGSFLFDESAKRANSLSFLASVAVFKRHRFVRLGIPAFALV